jgi:hypothetical protein
MPKVAPVLVVLGLLMAGSALAAEMRDTFKGPTLDEKLWNTCQAAPGLWSFGREGSRTFLVLAIDHVRGDVENCATPPALATNAPSERLGPSLIPPRRQPVLSSQAGAEDCLQPETVNGKTLVQRNELRFRPAQYQHSANRPHWYSIEFKLSGDAGDKIPDCGSARWVISQWKFANTPRGASDSPFLAQRFDNGVLHLTIEDDHCRCLVAKADGDPDRMSHAQVTPALPGAKLHPVPPLACRTTAPGPDEGKPCVPKHLKLFCSDPSGIPSLPDPKTDWVRMTYYIEGKGLEGTRIDVYANGRLVVRAKGDIVPGLPLPNQLKFKFGHYRDKIPVSARLMVHDVCLSETAAACDPSLQLAGN